MIDPNMDVPIESNNQIEKDLKPVTVGTKKGSSKGITGVLILVMVVTGGLIVALLVPDIFGILVNLLRYTLICVTSLFLLVSILVFIGLREEAKEIVSQVINGSLSTLDLLRELRLALLRTLRAIVRFVLRFIPIYTYFLTAIIYYAIMHLYKSVGVSNDVTLLTVILSSVMVLIVGFLSKPRKGNVDPDSHAQRFRRSFTDSFEVMLFVFFLTMDRADLFFLPAKLNTQLHASIGSYDLMERGFMMDSAFITTLNIILFTLAVEIIRQALRIFVYSRKYSKQLEADNKTIEKETKLKLSLSQGVSDNMDDIMKFIIYFTVLLLVFLFFPRLKLLAMLIASISSLILDFAIPERLSNEKQEDLIGRVISKVFRLQ